MKVLIIEDQKLSFENISRQLKAIDPKIDIDGPISNIIDMRNYMEKADEYDMIFSDIKLEDGLSFEALSDYPQLTTPIIFVTAYDEYALNAFRLGGLSYILKPIDISELTKAVNKAKQMNRGNQNFNKLLDLYHIPNKHEYLKRFLVKSIDGISIIQLQKINHIAYKEGKVIAYTNNLKHYQLQERSLDVLQKQLDPEKFFRANRQFIINIDAIKKIHTSYKQTESIELQNYTSLRIKISKDKINDLHKWIKNF